MYGFCRKLLCYMFCTAARSVFSSLAPVRVVGVIRAKVVRGPVAALMDESRCVYRLSRNQRTLS